MTRKHIKIKARSCKSRRKTFSVGPKYIYEPLFMGQGIPETCGCNPAITRELHLYSGNSNSSKRLVVSLQPERLRQIGLHKRCLYQTPAQHAATTHGTVLTLQEGRHRNSGDLTLPFPSHRLDFRPSTKTSEILLATTELRSYCSVVIIKPTAITCSNNGA